MCETGVQPGAHIVHAFCLTGVQPGTCVDMYRRPARHMRRHGEDLHGRAVFHSEPGSRRCAGLAAVRGACGGARNLDHEQPAMAEFLEPAVPQVVAAPAARPMASLNEWFAKIGGVAVYTNRISAELDGKDHPYRTWLSKQLPTEHAGTDPKTDAISMLGTRADCSHKSGHRSVVGVNLLRKMQELVIAQELRDWDEVLLCTLDSSVADELPCCIKYHHRGSAAHALAYSFMESGMDLPQWLAKIMSSVPCKSFCEKITASEMVAQGLGRSASLQSGVVKLIWHELLLNVNAVGVDGGATLRAKVQRLFPEHAEIINWNDLQTLATRVDTDVWAIIESIRSDRGMDMAPLPPTWLRQAYFLLPGHISIGYDYVNP